jgi:hypothetical protein
MYYAALCAIAKDEDHALPEWARHHLHIGFEHIYLYDNGSRTPIRDVLRDYVANGLVTVVDFPLTDRQQLSAYASSLDRFGKDAVWMGYIDIDEFVVPKTCSDVRELLDAYAAYAGLAVHWKIFGSNGHAARPAAGVIQSYTGVLDRNKHVKTIVKPRHVAAVATPHHFRYADGQCCVNEDGIPVWGPFSSHASRCVQLNHYYYTSREDFAEKMARGLATPGKDGRAVRNETEWETFDRQFTLAGEYDDAALRFACGLPDASAPEAPAAEWRKDFAAFAEDIARCAASGDVPQALAALRRCLRYHDGPQAWLVGAKLSLLADDAAACLGYLAKLLRDFDSPLREQGYLRLMEYYSATGEEEKAAGIAAELERI